MVVPLPPHTTNGDYGCPDNRPPGSAPYSDTHLIERLRFYYLKNKYPHWGWGVHKGLRCKNNDNTGCNTFYNVGVNPCFKTSRLYDRNPDKWPGAGNTLTEVPAWALPRR